MISKWDLFRAHVIGWKHWKPVDSRLRNITMRALVVISILLAVEASLSETKGITGANLFVGTYLVILSIAFFFRHALYLPLLTTKSFHMSAGRLARDTFVSALFAIMAFSVFYRATGLHASWTLNAIDHVYFSMVTFSTLGYGDIQPNDTGTRLVAALQALIGNLHLAVLVASIFLRMSRRQPPKIER